MLFIFQYVMKCKFGLTTPKFIFRILKHCMPVVTMLRPRYGADFLTKHDCMKFSFLICLLKDGCDSFVLFVKFWVFFRVFLCFI